MCLNHSVVFLRPHFPLCDEAEILETVEKRITYFNNLFHLKYSVADFY